MPRPLFHLALLLLLTLTALPATAADLEELREEGVIRFAMSGQYPPFNFVDAHNRLTGFDVEVCSELAGRLGVRPEPVATSWDGIIAGLLAGKYELICGSMAITDERLKAVDFTLPYYRSGAQLFVRRGAELAGVDDLEGRRIGVTLGTTYEEWVRKHLPEAEVRTYRGVPAMVLELATGRLDGFMTDRIVGAMAIAEKNAPIQPAGPLLYEERMGIALRQGNPALKAALDEALTAMMAGDRYRELSLKWLKIDAR